MMTTQKSIVLSDEDFREIFALFTSPTDEERNQAYKQESRHYFRKENLTEQYSVAQEKREFAVDAWRAVAYFLHRHGYSLTKDGAAYDLRQSSQYSVGDL